MWFVAAFAAALALSGVACWFVAIGGSTSQARSDVAELTEDTFADFVSVHPTGALVNFYSPGCQHCSKLAPEYEAAASELKTKGFDGVALASVNSEEFPTIALKYGVNRYPTMLWFRKGVSVLEVGPTTRTKEKLVEYVEWAMSPTIVDFADLEEFESALPTFRNTLSDILPPLVVGFANAEGAYDALEEVAEKLRGKLAFLFVHKPRGGASIRAYSHDPSLDQEYDGSLDPQSIHAWAKTLVPPKKKTEPEKEHL